MSGFRVPEQVSVRKFGFPREEGFSLAPRYPTRQISVCRCLSTRRPKMENAKSFLARCLGQVVVVTLKESRTLRGKLEGYDEFINLSLEEASEETPSRAKKLGRVVVRGSQVIAVHAPNKLPPAPTRPY